MAKQTSTTSRKIARSKLDLAAPVSERVEVREILLAGSMTKRGPTRDGLIANLAMGVNVATEVDKEKKVICVQLHFTLRAKYDEPKEEELLRIEAAFVLRYQVPSLKGLGRPSITAFGELNGVYNAWPYWREFVQNTTVRMGLPALTVPVYRPIAAKAPGKKKTTKRNSRPKASQRKTVASVAR